MTITTKQAILLGVLAEGVAESFCLLWYGAGAGGALVGARVTARVSAIVFSLALALRTRPALGASLMYGFVAAHAMHYAAVVYLAGVAVHHHLQHLSVRAVVVVSFGVVLLALIAATTQARQGSLRRLNGLAVSVGWLTFLGGVAFNGLVHWPAFIPLPPLLAAMGYHLRAVAAQRRSTAMAAGAS